MTGANTLLRHKTPRGRTLPHDLDCNLSRRHQTGASGSVVKGKEPGSPRKAWLVAGTPERRGNCHFYLLTQLMTRQQFAPERAVGGELARKRAGSMLSSGQGPSACGTAPRTPSPPCSGCSLRESGEEPLKLQQECAPGEPPTQSQTEATTGCVLPDWFCLPPFNPSCRPTRLSSSRQHGAWSSPSASPEPQYPSHPLLGPPLCGGNRIHPTSHLIQERQFDLFVSAEAPLLRLGG